MLTLIFFFKVFQKISHGEWIIYLLPFYKMKLFGLIQTYQGVMEVLLTGTFTTRKDNELVIYNQIKFTMNLLLEKKYGLYFFPIHTPLHLQRAKEMGSRLLQTQEWVGNSGNPVCLKYCLRENCRTDTKTETLGAEIQEKSKVKQLKNVTAKEQN